MADTMQAPYSPVKYAALPATPGSEFSWRPAAAAAATAADDRAAKLAAAAELARRCAALGVQPPLPLREPRPQPPQPAPAPGTAPQPDRLDALAQRLEQQGGLLASAVTQQSQQLAVQQRLLRDVVQGLLFVGAKAGRQGLAAGSAAATEAAPPPSAAPVGPAPAGRPPRPPTRHAAQPCEPAAVGAGHGAQLGSPERRRAALAQGLAAHLRQQAGAVTGTAGSSQEEEQGAASVRELPCGLLRVPAPPPPGRGTLGGLGRRGADLIRPLPCAPDHRHRGAAEQGPSSRRPAWDDRTVAPPPRHGRHAAAGEVTGSPVPARLAGGLAPQLLLAELQRLQRRRLVGGGTSTARRSLQAPLQQANRPLMAPGPGTMPVQACQLLQQAKEADAAAGAQPLAPQSVKRGTSAAAAAQAAPSSSRPAAAPGGGAMGGQQAAGPSKQRPPQKPVPPTKPAPLDLAALDSAVDPAEQPLPELSDNQMDTLCDALLREMLLEECAPCDHPPPCWPL